VHYHVYSIPPTDISPPYEVTTAPNPPTPPAISQTFNDSLEDIWKAESTLRESGVFVHVNAEKRELWVFPQPSQDSLRRSTVGHTPEEDVFKKYGVTLQSTQLNTPCNFSTNDLIPQRY